MSKSLDNYIGVDEPAELMFEKCMKVPDSILPDYFRLTTDIPENEYTSILADDIRQAHFVYAREIVRLYHGEDAVNTAQQRYVSVASGKMPDRMEVLAIAEGKVTLIDLLKRVGFATSSSDARRLVAGKGIKLDGETVNDVNMVVQREVVLSRGKNRFVQIRFN